MNDLRFLNRTQPMTVKFMNGPRRNVVGAQTMLWPGRPDSGCRSRPVLGLEILVRDRNEYFPYKMTMPRPRPVMKHAAYTGQNQIMPHERAASSGPGRAEFNKNDLTYLVVADQIITKFMKGPRRYFAGAQTMLWPGKPWLLTKC